MSFRINKSNFVLNDKNIFLLSGEIHYFRIRRELWEKHLQAAKDAGLMAVSSYVPWAWHEETEGTFDFDGSACPEKDLKGWIGLCHSYGLNCILKPGPFILAEFRGAGLPDWFMDQYGNEVKMHNSHGTIVRSDGISLFHPVFLEKVTKWYDRIMPLIAENEASAGGPVIMMQICNEIGVFAWLAHQGDYCDRVRERFGAYLSAKFGMISSLNERWGTSYDSFSDVELPPDGRAPYATRQDRGRDQEWHLFWRRYYGDYLRMMAGMARERGVTVPLYHNLPGWIYGHGYEFPVNITMYDDLFGEKSDIIFGVDHIPEFLSHRNMHDDRIINDIVHAMQGDKPLFAAEFQSGSREYHVVTNPLEMELFYKASIANGLTGWNYYMFSQGKNVPRKGYSGDTFYWFTPISANGERSGAYPLISRMNRMITTNEELIIGSERRAEICVLFYPPYYATELERPEEGASGLMFNASSIRRPAFFDGLLKALQVLNVDYDMADLTKTAFHDLAKYRQVWAFSTDEMNARDQKILVDYAQNGGQVVIYPALPDREMAQKQCTILRDALSIAPYGSEIIDSPLIDILGMQDIKCANPVILYHEDSLEDAEIIARTLSGIPCGFTKSLGAGSFIHLGAWTGFDTEGHKPVFEALLMKSGAMIRNATSDSEFLTVRQRFTGSQSGILFIGNYYHEDHTGSVSYRHPGSGETVSIPMNGEKMTWPALHGVISPLCLNLADGITLLHCTSDILGISKSDKILDIRIYGHRDLPGELVLEGNNIFRIQSACLMNGTIEMESQGSRKILKYNHQHKTEITLSLLLT